MKDKCVAFIQKHGSLTKLRRESEDSRGMVLASLSASQTCGLTSDFKACAQESEKSCEITHRNVTTPDSGRLYFNNSFWHYSTSLKNYANKFYADEEDFNELFSLVVLN